MYVNNIPNIFLLLEIDPDKPWDQTFYEQQLEIKRREWARDSLLPTKKGRHAKINLGHLSEMKRVAGHEALRNSQAIEARQNSQKEKAEKQIELDEHLEILQVKDYMLQDEFDWLVATHKNLVSETELRHRIKVEIRKEPQGFRKHQETLDAVNVKHINNWLEAMNKSDLYEFLGLSENTESKIPI